ncbi:hypothetical protein Mpet_2633 [Methanolacinia petrolearia DSM 11571]|uniref:Uncharacterized protein n=1 Tax=Methanolacinia petrolearia (strain DSM 11571 / OCM 486 / SEBR 4847) TaxID=679926 RepID=E1RFS2_METP4|nr:hypothetical protein [Methanolacinia petrolearia]ADN37376.1 hypothetical protein Mpet_2633 [Methanolacinia petrolearia DSM 11571]
MSEQEIECPKCKNKSVYIEHPDEYEVWLKCKECDFFLGMSADEWHRIHNSPNLDSKIKKMYEKEPGKTAGSDKKCRLCGASKGEKGFLCLCDKCCYKLLILVIVIMVIGSYMVWIALL